MLSKSGIDWNVTTKMIEASDEAWESYVKVDSNAKGMRYKSWPFYEEWCEVFGRDRATGDEAEGFADAVNGVLNETHGLDITGLFDSCDKVVEDDDPCADNISVSQPMQSSASKKNKGTKRRASDGADPMCEILSDFCKRTDARLSEIATRIGHDFDMSAAKKEVWAVMETFDGLSLTEKLIASRLLVSGVQQRGHSPILHSTYACL